MEPEFEKFAAQYGDKIQIAKYRGDEDRDFIQTAFQAKSFPTISLIGSDGSIKVATEEQRTVDKLKSFAGL
jgi:hypothetical protein